MRNHLAGIVALCCSTALAVEFRGIVVGEASTPTNVAAAIAGKCGRTWDLDIFVCTGDINLEGNRAGVVVVLGPRSIVRRIDLFLRGDREQARRWMLRSLGKPTRIASSDITVGKDVHTWEISTWEVGLGARASFRWTPKQPSRSIIYYNTKEEGDRMGGDR